MTLPLLDKLEELLSDTMNWDNAARNDFCRYVVGFWGLYFRVSSVTCFRYLYAVRSVWSGLPTILQEQANPLSDPCLTATRNIVPELLPTAFSIEAGFTLTNPEDPRYQTVAKHRLHFGRIIHLAAEALQGNVGGEDHIDAVIGVAKAIDVYLLEYASTKSAYIALQKNYALAREYVFRCTFILCPISSSQR